MTNFISRDAKLARSIFHVFGFALFLQASERPLIRPPALKTRLPLLPVREKERTVCYVCAYPSEIKRAWLVRSL